MSTVDTIKAVLFGASCVFVAWFFFLSAVL